MVTPDRGKNWLCGRKVDRKVPRTAPDELSAWFILPFKHYFKRSSDVSFVIRALNLPLAFEQNTQAFRLFFLRNAVFHVDGRCIWARGVFECKDPVILDLLKQ